MKIIDIFGRHLGEIGKNTNMIDSDGRELYIGDIVKLSRGERQAYSVVVEGEIEGMGGEVNPMEYSLTKYRHFDKIKPGERYHRAIVVNDDGKYQENEQLKEETKRELDKIINNIPLPESQWAYLRKQILENTEDVMMVLFMLGMIDEFERIADFYYKYPRYREDEMQTAKKGTIELNIREIWKKRPRDDE